MEVKFLWILCGLLAFTAARTVQQEDIEELDFLSDETNTIEPRIFENKILEAINAFKNFLANGDPKNGIPPLDPFFLDYKDFDFVIKDTALKGYLENTTFANFSRFVPVKVEFKLLPLHFKLELFLDQLHIDGGYELIGNFFNELPVNGSGKFISESKNLTLMLYIKPVKVNSALQIKDLLLEFKIRSEKINYTNGGNEVYELDEKLALYVLDKIQEKYVPPLLKMIKEVLNHILLGFKFDDILKIILDLLNKIKIFS